MPLDAEWLGLVARSESGQPHEWRFIMWAVRNRVEARRWSTTYAGVITQNKQFSYFNDYQHLEDEDAIFAAAVDGYAGDSSGDNCLDNAVECARSVIAAPRWSAPFSPKVDHFWSPISMRPVGSEPKWASAMYKIFTPCGIDSWRFRFGESK
jgi:hypothetical protein